MESRKDTTWERRCVHWPHGRGTADPSGLRLVLGLGWASVSSHLGPTSSAGFCCPGLPWIGPILCCLPWHSSSHCELPTLEPIPFPLLGPATWLLHRGHSDAFSLSLTSHLPSKAGLLDPSGHTGGLTSALSLCDLNSSLVYACLDWALNKCHS